MRILLIWPRPPNLTFEEYDPDRSTLHRFLSKFFSYPKPLTLPILAALTPKEHSVEMIEGGAGDINFDEKYDLVGITVHTRYALWAYEIADEFRRRGQFVVLGGWHPSALPEEAKQHANSVVIGEAEEIWPQLLKDVEMSKPKPFYYPTRSVDPKFIPHPLNLYPKGPLLGVQATRGCPYGCEFCAITNMKFRNIFRMRPIDEVIKEIKEVPGKVFNFHDNSMTINPDYSKKLFKEMKEIGKKFYAFGNINVLGNDEEFLKLASEAGCVGWLIGFESMSQESLDMIGKKTNKVRTYLSSVKKIHDHGMIILGSFVFGFDGDTKDIFETTYKFVEMSDIDAPDAMILTPHPGTPLFDRLDKEDRILTRDWNKYNYENVVFKPKHMTPDDLLTKTRELYKKLHSTSKSIRRITKSIRLGFRPTTETASQNLYLRLLRYQS